ncbi:MAG: ATP-binding protein [Thermoanaerobaculia bacterium]
MPGARGGLSVRTRIILYLTAVHAVLAAGAVFLLTERPMLLFAVELLFVASIAAGVHLVRTLFLPLEVARAGAELIAERDFTSRFAETGSPESDRLIEIYNRMAERLREERLAAEERHQLLEKIAAASPVAIVICDFDGEVERMNPAAERTITPELLAQLRVIPAGESRLVQQHGSRRFKASRAEFRDRGFVKTFYVVEELTEELRLSEKAAYEKLIRIMSHEVNNSVGAVRSLLESSLRYGAQLGEHDRGDFESALTIASLRIEALNEFMSGLAEVVRIPPPRRRPTAIAALVQRVIAVMASEMEAKEVAVEVNLADPSDYLVDAAQIEQVVLNVVRNAMEASGKGGRVSVTFVGGVLTVADSGPGISELVQPQLFAPFYTTKRDGRGIGLTLAHEILSAHGLEFSLVSLPREGAEFRIGFTSAVESSVVSR